MYAFGLSGGGVSGTGQTVILAASNIAANQLQETVSVVQPNPIVTVVELAETVTAQQPAMQSVGAIGATPSFVAALDVSDSIAVTACSPIIGPPGTDVGILTPVTLGENVDATRVIAVVGGLGYLADKDTVAHTNAVIGISVASGLAGNAINVQTGDELTELAWSWDTTKVIWLANSGLFTQVYPTTGFVQQIGKPITSNTMHIDIDRPMVLA